jgi:hypothetical protein
MSEKCHDRTHAAQQMRIIRSSRDAAEQRQINVQARHFSTQIAFVTVDRHGKKWWLYYVAAGRIAFFGNSLISRRSIWCPSRSGQ